MDSYRTLESKPESQHTRRTLGNESFAYSTNFEFTEDQSAYTMKSPQTSKNYQTDFMSDSPITMHSSRNSQSNTQGLRRETVKLMPVKIKDIMRVLNRNSKYRDKSPMIINMNENDIDQVIDQRRSGKQLLSPQNTTRQSPISVLQSGNDIMSMRTKNISPYYNGNQLTHPEEQASGHTSNRKAGTSKPPLGEQQAPQVYAMTDIQAYPMIGASSFRANKSKVQRKQSKRRKSRMKISPGRQARKRKRSRSRSRSRLRSRPRSRGRSRRPRSRPRRIVKIRRPRRKSPVVVVSRPRYPFNDPFFCSPYPMCDRDCSYEPNIPLNRGLSTSCNCNCRMCQEKLQFIQPSICSKKRHFWTNEYAILPKPQVNLIDPCTELDPCIYPRADNPCIRDGRGNPLTDCIGRPLRDPVGKRFLNFSANGSVMDTNLRGNFYTGQPPLCVKCTLPGNTCVPDTTHNWWMSCGYPIRPDMNPYFQRVVASENRRYRR